MKVYVVFNFYSDWYGGESNDVHSIYSTPELAEAKVAQLLASPYANEYPIKEFEVDSEV
jgi:hypothetical protein